MSALSQYITLYELQSLIRQKINDSHPLPYWVAAEVSELKVNYSGHCYLELVEKGGDNAVPRAKANAVIWRNQYDMISAYFRTATGGDLQAGIKILAKVAVNYHELYGLSFQITDIEPSFTLGDIESQRRETIERLQKEGVYDMNRECELPEVMQRLAVVSSRNAAGFQDFMNELESNSYRYAYRVELFDSFMQGNETEESVIAALDAIAERMDCFDAVALIRGGGSQSDLGAFNSYRMCSHIAQFPLPVIAGIGHDKDKSVADLVARLSLKTPTAAAVALVEHNAEFEGLLDEYADDIAMFASGYLADEKARLSETGYLLKEAATKLVHGADYSLENIKGALESRSSVLFTEQRGRLKQLAASLASLPLRTIGLLQRNLTAMESSLLGDAASLLAAKSRELELLQGIVDARTPEKILKMGYAIVRSGGSLVRNVADAPPRTEVSVQLFDGTIEAEVK